MVRHNPIPVIIMTGIVAIFILVSLLLTTGCLHPGPAFPIENRFGQPVSIYFNGVKVGNLKPGEDKIFYPNEVLTKADTNLLLEAEDQSGKLLFSRDFSWSQLSEVIEKLHGEECYVIGDGSD